MPNNTEETAERELTYGERAVGLTFNPSNDPNVQKTKEHYAFVIDLMDVIRSAPATSPEKKRLCSIAITEAQAACMWAVKAITWQD